MNPDDPQWRRRLLVVEDEPLTARLLRDALEGLDFEVAMATSAVEARAVLADFDPDVALVDLVLGGGPSGADLAHMIHATHPGVGILILTRYPDLRSAGFADDALPPGAGFVRKDMVEDSRYIVAAIDDVVAERSAEPRHDAQPDRPLAVLTPAQHEVLRMMAQGYDNASIAGKRGCSESSVQNLIAEVYKRLGIDPRNELNPRVEAVRVFASVAGLPDRD
jgi:DNA-binding NarL/FixJ family response regulator